MDNPFLPALICFGPFLGAMLYGATTWRHQEPKKTPPVQVAAAIAISLVLGVAGATISFVFL